jgi:hypothetical protein
MGSVLEPAAGIAIVVKSLLEVATSAEDIVGLG